MSEGRVPAKKEATGLGSDARAARPKENLNPCLWRWRLCAAEVTQVEHLLGLLVTGSVVDSRG